MASVQVAAAAPTESDPLASTFNMKTGPPPSRKSLTAFYMHKYYVSHVKDAYQRTWSRLSAVWDATSEEEKIRLGLQKPSAVAVRANISKEFLDGESAAFRAELQLQNQADYEERMEAWSKLQEDSVTAQQFHQ